MRHFRLSFKFGTRFDDDLAGTDGPDFVLGFAGDDRIVTKAGNDVVIAGKGDDDIDSGADNDRVLAGRGDDMVRTGAGDDRANGGRGFDTATYDGAVGDYEIDRSGNGKKVIVSSKTAPDGGTDHLRKFEALYFQGDDYTLYLDGTNNPVLAGDDTAETGENDVLTLQVADLLANDREFDGDSLSLISVSATSAAGAAVTLLNGEITYEPGLIFDDLATGETAVDTFTYVVGDGRGGTDTATVTVTIVGEDDLPEVDARINEFHYDNAGTDAGEFVEIRTASGDDVSALTVELVNGSNGSVYNSIAVADLAVATDGTWDYHVWSLPTNGLQNGSPDGIVLTNGSEVIEFLSYEGQFVATGGAAAGSTSTDIGVSEPGDTPFGQSLQRETDGSWSGPRAETPGAANDAPPVLVITEIMQNPSAVPDSAGEWFELHNPGDTDIDIDGWTISDNGADSHVIDNGGPLIVPAGGYLVLGNNADMASNGGVPVAYSYGSNLFLANGDDELVLTDPATGEIDRVEWDGGPDFPDPTGASMALIDPALDNNVGANWTTSAVPYGAGDLGTPGADNGGGGGGEMRLISAVQGAGTSSPFAGSVVQVDAIVTHTLGNGFLIQEEDADADADAGTSEGIFVFTGSGGTLPATGDRVQVTGTVVEFFGETQIGSLADLTVVSSGNALPTPTTVTFPVADSILNDDGELIADLEAYEGMRVNLPQSFTISDLFTLGRFADMGLHQGGRLETFTQSNAPDVAGFQAYQELAVRNTIVIDDGSAVQNPAVIPFEVDGVTGNIAGQYDAADPLSAGDTASDITGVVRFSRASGGSGDQIYRIIPTERLVIEDANPQTSAPDVGGRITVSAFNVLNFFTTIDDGTATSGPGGLQPRGADSLAEFERQADKLIAALAEIGADVFGLVEVENEFGDQNGDGQWSVQYLVDALNSEIPGAAYTFADPGTAFGDTGDAITVALIYDASTVEIAAGTTVEYLTDADLPGLGLDFGNPVFDGSGTSRAPVAATFEEIASGEQFTVSVNHFKSKGSVSPFGDNAGTGDGAGNNNEARLQAATALDTWLDGKPTGTTDEDVLIIGDLNAYGMEDPVQYLLGEGYVDQVGAFLPAGGFAYSFGFPVDLGTSPQVQAFGALDYALANNALASQVAGAAEWHISADEASIRDYNLEFRPPEQVAELYSDDPFRASDHDPLIIGLDLGGDPLLM